ncbi:hypothetical protein SDC9_112484 [bioreactor metagenome]|uniref:Uncharacterized protein n=1 Tax=bioreactor metagenome TaxID=1076179 RepID=A0A645BJR6_9ZZZZ
MDGNSSQCCNAHQEHFVKQATSKNIPSCTQQHRSADEQICGKEDNVLGHLILRRMKGLIEDDSSSSKNEG